MSDQPTTGERFNEKWMAEREKRNQITLQERDEAYMTVLREKEQLQQQLAAEREISNAFQIEAEDARTKLKQIYDWLKLASKNATNDEHLAAATKAVLSIIGEQ